MYNAPGLARSRTGFPGCLATRYPAAPCPGCESAAWLGDRKDSCMSDWTKGFWAMIAVCVTWGLSPIYYRALSGVPTVEVLAHRTLWSLVLFLIVLAVQGRLGALREALTGRWVGRITLAA